MESLSQWLGNATTNGRRATLLANLLDRYNCPPPGWDQSADRPNNSKINTSTISNHVNAQSEHRDLFKLDELLWNLRSHDEYFYGYNRACIYDIFVKLGIDPNKPNSEHSLL